MPGSSASALPSTSTRRSRASPPVRLSYATSVRELTDCHIHTRRCGHAIGTVDECAREAARKGLVGIVMTEHLALPEEFDPDRTLSMRETELDEYLVEVDLARQRYPELAIVAGIEADYLPGREAETRAAIAASRVRADGVRVVLGSVHFLDGWAFDNPDPVALGEWDRRDVDAVWGAYFSAWCDATRSGLFEVMAHPDLVKKFGHRPTFDPRELYAEAARAAQEAGVLVEVSTAGLRKPVGELYPGPELLARFCEAGVSATVGSDAHAPAEVGYALDAAYDAMLVAGYETAAFPDGSGGWRSMSL